jgi:hypothetical protein
MTREKQVATSKGGRPPRVKGEKLQRINLSLRPAVLIGLDIVARDRNISLSQAVEYVFATASKSYPSPLPDNSLMGGAMYFAAVEKFGPPPQVMYKNPPLNRDQDDEMLEFGRATGLIRAILLPDRLLTAEEKYLLEVFSAADKPSWKDGALLLDLVRGGFSEGAAAKDVALDWQRQVGSGSTKRKKPTSRRVHQ